MDPPDNSSALSQSAPRSASAENAFSSSHAGSFAHTNGATAMTPHDASRKAQRARRKGTGTMEG